MTKQIYGPFFDEELFSYNDTKSTLELDSVEIHHADLGFIGLDDLEPIHHQGRAGSFDKVIFSGITTLEKTSGLCERGFKGLLKSVQVHDPDATPAELRKLCKQGKIKVELQCQLALMPVCYMTKSPANSILIYSKNYNNAKNQRRYIVNTFHISCFHRSELTLQRYFVLKFVLDTCHAARNDVPRERRDVRWLVGAYMQGYNALFNNHQRPRLHRAEVYDHFATHAKWLKGVFSMKLLVDKAKWEDWIDVAMACRKKARRKRHPWGASMKRAVPHRSGRQSQQPEPSLGDIELWTQDMNFDHVLNHFPDTNYEEADSDEPVSSTESEMSGDDAPYAHTPELIRERAHSGLFRPMPMPTWYWTCDIKEDCAFVIDIGHTRTMDGLCMAPLTTEEKQYLMGTGWGLYDLKLAKVWRKMCQAHMDMHWREEGLVVDHQQKRIYAVEDEVHELQEDD